MRIVVVGGGSIGTRHAANARNLGHEVIVVDPLPGRGDTATLNGISWMDAAIVAVPMNYQIAVADRLLESGIPTLIEKPCGPSAFFLRGLSGQIQVGYNLRFDDSLLRFRDRIVQGDCGKILWASISFGQHISQWRPGRDYHDTPAVDGILLEAAHEIDLALWLFGPLLCVNGAFLERRSGYEVREDIVAAILRMESGVPVELHLDMLQHRYHRQVTVCGERDTLTWTPSWLGPAGPNDGVNQMYLNELESFVACVSEGCQPEPGIAEAIAVHEVIDQIRAADQGEVEGMRPMDWMVR